MKQDNSADTDAEIFSLIFGFVWLALLLTFEWLWLVVLALVCLAPVVMLCGMFLRDFWSLLFPGKDDFDL